MKYLNDQKTKYQGNLFNRYKQFKTNSYNGLINGIKNTPSFMGKTTWTGIKFGGFLTKQFLKTKPGKYTQVLIGSYFLTRSLYVYGTHFERELVLDKVFMRIGENGYDGKNEYMIADQHNRIYSVCNSPWYLQFYSTEMWTGLHSGKKYKAHGYGIRFAAWGIYPNIVHISPINKSNNKKSKKSHTMMKK